MWVFIKTRKEYSSIQDLRETFHATQAGRCGKEHGSLSDLNLVIQLIHANKEIVNVDL